MAPYEPMVAREIGLHEPVPEDLRPPHTSSAKGKLLFRRYPPLYLTPTVQTLWGLAKHYRRGTPIMAGALLEWPSRLVHALDDAVSELELMEARAP